MRVSRLLLPLVIAIAIIVPAANPTPAWSATPVASPAASPVASPAAVELPKNVPAGVEPVQVRGHLDGAGLKVRIAGATEHEEVVLIGVDAPRKKNRAGTNDCYASELAVLMRELVPNKSTVYLERDATDRDTDGKLPRFVWVLPSKGEKAFLLNTKLVRDGAARLGTMASSGKYAANFGKADQLARDGNRGLWGECYAPNGEWAGITNEGDAIAFTVADHGLTKLVINYICADQNGNGYWSITDTMRPGRPKPLAHDGFNINFSGGGDTVEFAGAFTSPTEATGTLQVTANGGSCAGLSLTTSWHATLQ